MSLQLPLFGASTRPSRPLLAHRRAPGFLRRLELCLRLFPELQEQEIRVGVTRSADGLAVLDDMAVRFDLRRRIPSHYTIGHELTHLIQALRLVPHGEIQCDIWTIARHPVFLDEAPCYLPVPDALRQDWARAGPSVAALCAEAINNRPTRRTYIQWLSGRLGQLAAGWSAQDPTGPPA